MFIMINNMITMVIMITTMMIPTLPCWGGLQWPKLQYRGSTRAGGGRELALWPTWDCDDDDDDDVDDDDDDDDEGYDVDDNDDHNHDLSYQLEQVEIGH